MQAGRQADNKAGRQTCRYAKEREDRQSERQRGIQAELKKNEREPGMQAVGQA